MLSLRAPAPHQFLSLIPAGAARPPNDAPLSGPRKPKQRWSPPYRPCSQAELASMRSLLLREFLHFLLENVHAPGLSTPLFARWYSAFSVPAEATSD